ncbi:hypothetical protein GCM10025857_10930 [Alicyclobacillus contaminans]|nr:hypothetical protein GCM10025857_10930 [Alicyclobacillus contaminans]
MITRQDIRRFRHEVNAAEDDVLRRPVFRSQARQLERVAGQIRELNHFILLIVMPENQQPLPKCGFGSGDALCPFGGRELQIRVGNPDLNRGSRSHAKCLLHPYGFDL